MRVMTRDPMSGDFQLNLSLRDQAFLIGTLWFCVTIRQFKFDELLLYPLALYFGISFLLYYRHIDLLVRKGFVLFLFPIWCVLSVVWALEPGAAGRSAIQLVLTIMVCFWVVSRMTPREVLLAMFIASTMLGFMNLFAGFGAAVPARGVFESKNQMGASMIVLWLTGLCMAVDRDRHALLRLAGLGVLPLAAYLIYISNSFTALTMAAMVTVIVVGGSFFIFRGSLLRIGPFAALFVVLGVGLAGVATVASTTEVDPFQMLLDAGGKDRTLTKRTIIWAYAEREIAERPLLGVGGGGFWVGWDNSPDVRALYVDADKSRATKTFNFHNAYYEIAVHQGLIGLAIVLLPLAWATYWIFRDVIAQGGIAGLFFLSMLMVVLIRSTTESVLMAQFNQQTMLVWIGALYAVRRQLELQGRAEPIK